LNLVDGKNADAKMNHPQPYFDIVIGGTGAVGLFLAYSIKKRYPHKTIAVLDKETHAGLHTSGRNSGVLHAGIYYKPSSLKAQVCVSGSRRLGQWVKERKLPLNECGKLILPQSNEVDEQIEILAARGMRNGAEVEIVSKKKINELCPYARSATGRGLWSPMTKVTSPKHVINQLVNELENLGVAFVYEFQITGYDSITNCLSNGDDKQVYFGHFFNCLGLYSDKIAQLFGVGNKYTLVPFKGLYWDIDNNSGIDIHTNIYPVPDLNMPFLGVHLTPSALKSKPSTVGPTATIAWGRENYRGIDQIDPTIIASNLSIIGSQYINNQGGFRNYVHEQALLFSKGKIAEQAQKLIPELKSSHLSLSKKVGIRPQLFNNSCNKLEDDFICIAGKDSTHVVNAISPAFSASFALSDLIMKESGIRDI